MLKLSRPIISQVGESVTLIAGGPDAKVQILTEFLQFGIFMESSDFLIVASGS